MSVPVGLLAGGLEAAVASVKDAIRREPSDPAHRAAYFQLLCVSGDWSRAADQLKLLVEFDPGKALFAQVYGRALQCEAQRARVASGASAPVVFGEPAEWLGALVEAFRFSSKGDWDAAGKLQAQAFEMAPETPGRIDGVSVSWIADADARFGPVMEAFIEGHYRWVPFTRITRITFEAPTHLIDAVWFRAKFTWTNGGTSDGLVPVRYCGSESSVDHSIRSARRTEWEQKGEQYFIGYGQRMLTSDGADHPLLDVRDVQMTP